MKAGDKYRDREGDVWTVDQNGDLYYLTDSSAGNLPFEDVDREIGPLLPLHAHDGYDPVDPDHYKFPGGAEVINISEHLTSNAGQAVQYLARACRIDGRVKGNPVEDVRKAIWFVQRELDRLEAES